MDPWTPLRIKTLALDLQVFARRKASEAARKAWPSGSLPEWVHGAAGTLPVLDVLGFLVTIIGLLITAACGNLWILPVVGWVAVLAIVVCGLHWRATYLREVKKEADKATKATFLIVASFIVFGILAIWPITQHISAEPATKIEDMASGMHDEATLTVVHPAPLIPMREQFKMIRGVNADVRGRVVFSLVVVNPSPVILKARIYSSVMIRPFVSMTADAATVENEILSAKDEVRRLAGKHEVEEVSIEPGSVEPGGKHFGYKAVGPYVSDNEWALISSGDKYVYLYSLIAVNDDPLSPTSIPICAIGNGSEVDDCDPNLEKW